MGRRAVLNAEDEIEEGDPLEGATLAALVVRPCSYNPPLLRINPSVVAFEQRDAVRHWASEELSKGRAAAILRADALTGLI